MFLTFILGAISFAVIIFIICLIDSYFEIYDLLITFIFVGMFSVMSFVLGTVIRKVFNF